MIEVKLCVSLAVLAGATSAGMLVDLHELGASGDFGLQVVTPNGNACSVTYTASMDDNVQGVVDEPGLVLHAGGKRVYTVDLVPARKVWFYVTAGAANVTATLTLGVW